MGLKRECSSQAAMVSTHVFVTVLVDFLEEKYYAKGGWYIEGHSRDRINLKICQ